MTTLKNKKGVSLVELIAVIVIMGIIATVGGISVATIINNSNDRAAESSVADVISAAQTYFNMNADEKSVTVDQLTTGDYLTAAAAGKFTTGFKVWKITNANKTYYTLTSGSVNTAPTATTAVVVVTKAGKQVSYDPADGSVKVVKDQTPINPAPAGA